MPQPAAVGGLRFGVPADFFFDDLDDAVADCVKKALAALREAGMKLIELKAEDLPDPRERETLFPTIVGPEIFASLGNDRFNARRDEMDSTTAKRAAIGRDVSAVDYVLACRRQKELKWQLDEVFRRLDGIVMPTTPMVAMPLSELETPEGAARSITASRNTQPGISGVFCGISLPVHQYGSDLPVGLQVLCRHGSDARPVGRTAIEALVGRPESPVMVTAEDG